MIVNTSLKKKKKKNKKKKDNRLVKGLIKKLPKKPTKDDWIKFNEWVNEKERCLNSKIFQKNFNYQRPSSMLKELYKINDKYKNNDLVNVIKNGLSDLKKKIENMCEKEKEIEQLNEIRYCWKIIELNSKNQLGLRLPISRLPISSAQLKAGNNSEKLKNEIRQLLYSL